MSVHVDAATPAVRTDDHFLERHRAYLAVGRRGPIDLLFLGDSITRRWEEVPDLWRRYYGRLRAANFGVGGDATQNVLWRIENGELDGIAPRVVVLLIGTNNLPVHSAAETAAGISAVVDAVRARLPGAKVLLIALLPRGRQRRPSPGEDRSGYYRDAVDEVNAVLRRLDDGVRVRLLDFGPRLLGPDGELDPSLVPDGLHLAAPGYEVWAEAMGPLLAAMAG